MKYNPDVHKRESLRLQNYDYWSKWLYFITIWVKDKLCLFWEISNDVLNLFDSGKMIETLWLKLEDDFKNIKLHEYIIMPNHFHWIIEITKDGLNVVQDDLSAEKNSLNIINRVNTRFTPTGGRFEYDKQSISSIMQAFKSKTTHQYIQWVYNNGWSIFNKKLWQKDFYEHIIRDEKSYNNISEYIQQNPIKWEEDKIYYTQV